MYASVIYIKGRRIGIGIGIGIGGSFDRIDYSWEVCIYGVVWYRI